MSLTIGSRLGTYEVLAPLGAGGMGEVYRARDAKLGRDVALKVLAAAFTADPDRLARFEREARILAALNHPNIATIHGLEEAGDVRALVMELVTGETLTEHIVRASRGAGRVPPLAGALGIARQIAAALDAAHAQGVVHRDLKPDNVMITPTGTVKVLDFGVAKIRDSNETSDRSSAATTAAGETRIGTVLGTAAYMSPEQARGLPVDQRTDVWAFGCVLYELLTGHAAFEGATVTDTLAAVLEREPDWERLPAAVPADVRRLLQRCLQKDAHRRLRDIGDARWLIDDALRPASPQAGAADSAPRRAARRTRIFAGAAVVLLAVLGAAAAIALRPAPPGQPVLRLSVQARNLVPQAHVAISPDGRHVAFVADASGRQMLWVRTLDAADGRAIPGTEDAIHPFWSPDSRSLGFVANGALKRVDVSGGPVVTLATTDRGGGAWSKDNLILFTRGFDSGLWTISAAGGQVTQVTFPDPSLGEVTHAWPQFLPDGQRFLYYSPNADAERRGVYVGSLRSAESRRVLATGYRAWYAPPGYLLFIQEENEALLAQSFDAGRLELRGQPGLVAAGVWINSTAGQASFSASDTGVIAYANASMWNRQLTWFDRQGRILGVVGPPDRYGGTSGPAISADGARLAIARGPWMQEDVWVLGASDGASIRLSFSPGRDAYPVWSPDGSELLYQSGQQLSLRSAHGSGAEERLPLDGPLNFGCCLDWSRDGRFAVYGGFDGEIWMVPLEGDRRPVRFLETPSREYVPQLSPDGRWLAYTSDESGREEVYVQRFPEGGSKRQISYQGGNQPRWRGDGRELFYRAADARLMVVAVAGGTGFDAGAPAVLFEANFPSAIWSGVGHWYNVTPDGQRFLAVGPTVDTIGPPITIVTNWRAALPRESFR